MAAISHLILVLYFLTFSILTVYGLHRSVLLWKLWSTPLKRAIKTPSERIPRVTVQLPIYNEAYVVERLIDAVCSLDYPRDRLEIQVLDDSDDETIDRARNRILWHQAQGIPICHVTRTRRIGFKAGALEEGLRSSQGEFIAIFDADFVPGASFLRDLIPYFGDPSVGMVQARWGHINAEYSILTRIQAALLEGHFQIEHAARYRADFFFNFNGTAGIWRRVCIEESGGWQHDTVTEDLDLSYRAQLAGWKFVYCPEVVVPAEVPVEMSAFKAQQRRWAAGSIQTALKLLPRILAHPLPLRTRLAGLYHLTSNGCYVGMLALAVLLPPATLVRSQGGTFSLFALDSILFVLSVASVTSFYLEAQREIEPRRARRWLRIPGIMALGVGMSLSNGLAVLSALRGKTLPFVRTPKHRIESRQDRPRGYRISPGALPIGELALGLYLSAGVYGAVVSGFWPSLPFLILFALGFFAVGLGSVLTGRRQRQEPGAVQRSEHPFSLGAIPASHSNPQGTAASMPPEKDLTPPVRGLDPT